MKHYVERDYICAGCRRWRSVIQTKGHERAVRCVECDLQMIPAFEWSGERPRKGVRHLPHRVAIGAS